MDSSLLRCSPPPHRLSSASSIVYKEPIYMWSVSGTLFGSFSLCISALPPAFNYYSFTESFVSGKHTSTTHFLFQVCLGFSFAFSVLILESACQVLCKTLVGYWIELYSIYRSFEWNDIFRILSLPIHEHGHVIPHLLGTTWYVMCNYVNIFSSIINLYF